MVAIYLDSYHHEDEEAKRQLEAYDLDTLDTDVREAVDRMYKKQIRDSEEHFENKKKREREKTLANMAIEKKKRKLAQRINYDWIKFVFFCLSPLDKFFFVASDLQK
jgi:hypothetical protein